ncbi:DUF2142 domain-containing protein [Candidatus Gottesmanbacteria bacterium]|nr:DUF2142 domain-containing protein [Candidatus Gottesmanbacteria bacterium]
MVRPRIMTSFFLAVFFNALVWVSLVPLWHFPDEQAHFGQVAFFAENGRMPIDEENDLTQEVYTSEILLGTFRDNLGKNRFTHHPEYRIEYTDSFYGMYEASLAALSKEDTRKQLVHRESTRYPPLYYIPASFFYKFFYHFDLFTRVVTTRIWSLFLFMGTIYITYSLAKRIFQKTQESIAIAALVGFQPMMIFANVGVNSDALGNFLFIVFLIAGTLMVLKGINLNRALFLSISSLFCVLSKPQFIITLPLVVLLFFFVAVRDLRRKDFSKRVIILPFIICAVFILLYKKNFGSVGLIDQFMKTNNISSLLKFTWEYSLPHSVREVMPWFWGIYDWLGVTYPRSIHRIINRIVFVAVVGLIPAFFIFVKRKMWYSRRVQSLLFLAGVAFVYIASIFYYDWFSWYTGGYVLGVQGRYLFPTISIYMVILLIGWRQLFSFNSTLHTWSIFILSLLMICLNIYALYTIAKTYYDISSFSIFLTQVSQYKPWFFKGVYSIFLWLVTIISLVTFLLTYVTDRGKGK